MSSNTLKKDSTDLSADYYEKNSSLQNNLAREILDSYRVNPKAHILDIGCGDGRITAELSKRAQKGKVLGVDSSPSMIRFASKNFPISRFSNLRFSQKKAEELKLLGKFDLIVSFSCFHWLREPEAAFQRLSDSLKQDGELLILTYPKESYYYQYLEQALKSYPDYQIHSAYHTMLSTNEYKKLLLRNNLEILNFEKRDLTASYDSSMEIQEFIKGWLNSYVPLPETLHQEFLQCVCQAILDDPKTQEGNKTVVPYSALIIGGYKK